MLYFQELNLKNFGVIFRYGYLNYRQKEGPIMNAQS